MRIARFLLFCLLIATACDTNRVFENNKDFEKRYWLSGDQPSFDFQIDNTSVGYNLYCNLRNEISYPNSRIFLTYHLSDSTGKELQKAMISEYLFDKKTGEPFGKSGLGDIYDHRFLLLKNYAFLQPGKYTMRFEQFMRSDTLRGVLAVGLRVERTNNK